jgi:hypothetical protein
MISKQSFLDISNSVVAQLMPNSEGGVNEADNTIKELFKNVVMLLAFIQSTGKAYEYETWIKKFHIKHSGLDKQIKDQFEIEEQKIELCQTCKYNSNNYCSKLKRNIDEDFGCVWHEEI